MVNKGIVIPAIQTDAMRTVRQNNEIPFALLHFLKCVPLLVRVIEFHGQSLLRPATKYDFDELRSKSMKNPIKRVSVPVVAAVYQTIDSVGSTSFVVLPPKNISKFKSDLKNLTIQDAVFSMAMNPAAGNNCEGSVLKKRRPTNQVNTTSGSKRKVRSLPSDSKRQKSDNQKATGLKLSEAVVPSKAVTEHCALMAHSSYEVVEQEHLSDNGDISEAIRGFATGSFLSPKKSRSEVNVYLFYFNRR